MSTAAPLADALLDALPQTQCTRCGFADCRTYAEAIADGSAAINRCPPGGAEGIARLARLTGRAPLPLDPACGAEGPRRLAVIDEAWCIGCTLCIKACPVDCIVGAPKRMHTVIESLCSGCELCIEACPVDCIALLDASGELTGWQAWSQTQAQQARERYALHRLRSERDEHARSARLDRAAAPPGDASFDGAAPDEASSDAALPDGAATGSRPLNAAAGRKHALVAVALARAREARKP